MARFLCPACGADIPFRSTDSVTTICTQCGSMLIRKDLTLESIGKVATLPDDMTPLQIGTVGKCGAGKWKGKGFAVIGRTRVDWAEGSWNEWYVAFDDGAKAWLAEAQGSWAILEEAPLAIVNGGTMPTRDQLLPGNSAFIGKTQYEVADTREAWVRGVQGELPKAIEPGTKYRSIDLTTSDGKGTATLAFHTNGAVEVYAGEWREFDDFGFTGLREMNGW